jgi:uncharacterized membrane protein YphA (DoxX/SURF4 family)
MNRLGKTVHWMNQNRDVFIDILRTYLGLALLFKGIYFLSHTAVLHSSLGTGGITMGQAMLAHIISSIHILGGSMLAIGFLTRPAALLQIPVLAGAVFFVHLREGLFANPNLEFSGLTLICLIIIAGYGSGRLSADHYVFKADEIWADHDTERLQKVV